MHYSFVVIYIIPIKVTGLTETSIYTFIVIASAFSEHNISAIFTIKLLKLMIAV